MNKRYWLKLNEHFFDDDKIVWLESQRNGEKYVLVWVKILLKCLKNRDEDNIGFLRFTDKLPYTDELLSKAISVDIDTLRVAMKYFDDLGMVERLDDGTLYVEAVQSMIGRETSAAERMRKMRENRKLLQITQVKRNNVTDVTCNELHNKELEKEEEEEEEKEKDIPAERKEPAGGHSEIVKYYFEKCKEKGIDKPSFGAQHGSAVKRILGKYGIDDLKKMLDEWFVKDIGAWSGFNIACFEKDENKISLSIAGKWKVKSGAGRQQDLTGAINQNWR
jgi:predicted phage replisome organizer